MAMPDRLATLRRPRLLVLAARKGLPYYKRKRDLKVILGARATGGNLLARLIAEEAELNHLRRSGDSAYSPAAHISVLTALIAEARSSG